MNFTSKLIGVDYGVINVANCGRFPGTPESCKKCSLLHFDEDSDGKRLHRFNFVRCVPAIRCVPDYGKYFSLIDRI